MRYTAEAPPPALGSSPGVLGLSRGLQGRRHTSPGLGSTEGGRRGADEGGFTEPCRAGETKSGGSALGSVHFTCWKSFVPIGRWRTLRRERPIGDKTKRKDKTRY